MAKKTYLGDHVAGMTKLLGVKPCESCKERQAALNHLHKEGSVMIDSLRARLSSSLKKVKTDSEEKDV